MKQPFPATYSTLSASALLTDVLPDYGLGPLESCTFHDRGVNDTYRVQAESGTVYFLRVYRCGLRSRSDVGYELDMLNHLHRKGVPAIRPLPNGDGSLVREIPAPEGKRYAVLFTEAVGREPDYDDDPAMMAARYGQAVARMHNALDDFSSSYHRTHADIEHLIDGPLRHIEPVLSAKAEDWAYVQRFAATVRQRILEAPAGGLEQGACHGDLQGFHAHIDADGTMTFYDFDFCGYGYRAYDLSVFRWSARYEKPELEQVWWQPYLRAYRQVRPVSGLDVEYVPLFICARHIWHMGLHTANGKDWGYGPLGEKYFGRRLEWLRALEADYLT